MGVKRFFEIKRLKPFHREAKRMPRPAPEKSDEVTRLDPDLRPEEQSYVNHYLGYADVLLDEPDSEGTGHDPSRRNNIIELPRMQDPQQPEQNNNQNQNKGTGNKSEAA